MFLLLIFLLSLVQGALNRVTLLPPVRAPLREISSHVVMEAVEVGEVYTLLGSISCDVMEGGRDGEREVR